MTFNRIGFDWKRRLRRSLWDQQGGKCHWCGRETYPDDHPKYKRSTGALSGMAATLDHLYSKIHDLHGKSVEHSRYVMACNTCNGRRSTAECKAGMQKNNPRSSDAASKPISTEDK